MSFDVQPLAFVTGPERERAVQSLKHYRESFTGRHFDELILASDSGRFTERDFFAVSMLSVSVPPEAGLALLGDPEIPELLSVIPTTANIDEPGVDYLERDGAAWLLWRRLHDERGLGPTITSKLLAAKRPWLVPVHDQHVSRVLMGGRLNGEWSNWREAMLAGELQDAVTDLRRAADVDQNVSALRILDIVIWMRAQGDLREGDVRFWE